MVKIPIKGVGSLYNLFSWLQLFWSIIPANAPIKNLPIRALWYSNKYQSLIVEFHDNWKLNIRERKWYYGRRIRPGESHGKSGTW